jgi:peptidoglycan-N-acetylglucosamine deacetylase
LSHDIHPGTIEAMPSTFDALQAKGFKFVTVSELIRAAAVEPSPTSPSTSTSARAAIPLSPSPSPASSPGN